MEIRRQPEGQTIILSDELVAECRLQEGDTGPWASEFIRRPDRERAIERLRAFRGMLPAGVVFDWDEANRQRSCELF
ncbi:MAG: transcriptional regulator/antitoxin MazE [Tistrella sp.]|nr:transcriptional regulator/antitoxin MazE [Tistrella sp.]